MWMEVLEKDKLQNCDSESNVERLRDKIISGATKSYNLLLFTIETSAVIGAEYFLIYKPYLNYLLNK